MLLLYKEWFQQYELGQWSVQDHSPKHGSAHAAQELCCYGKAAQGPALRKYQRQTPQANQTNLLITSAAAPWPKSHQDHWLHLSTYLRNHKFLLLPSIRQQHKCASIDYEIWTQKCQIGEANFFLSEEKVDIEWPKKHLPFIAFSQGKKFWTSLNTVLLLFFNKIPALLNEKCDNFNT